MLLLLQCPEQLNVLYLSLVSKISSMNQEQQNLLSLKSVCAASIAYASYDGCKLRSGRDASIASCCGPDRWHSGSVSQFNWRGAGSLDMVYDMMHHALPWSFMLMRIPHDVYYR